MSYLRTFQRKKSILLPIRSGDPLVSVSGNLAEGWRKRRYSKSFIAKLTDSEGEAAETQVWLDYAFKCKYIDAKFHHELFDQYDHIIAMIVNMVLHPEKWKF